MKPIINLDDPVVKTYGKRQPPADSFEAGMALQKTGADLMRSLGHRLVPRGVYRFKTFEEADEWMEKMIIRNLKR